MNEEKVIDTLIKNDSLHDSDLTGISLKNNSFQIEFDCAGMGLSYYDKDIENVYVRIKLTGIKKLNFDFIDGIITVIDCTIKEENNNVSLTVNDNELEVIAEKIEYDVKIIRRNNELLDNFLKSNL